MKSCRNPIIRGHCCRFVAGVADYKDKKELVATLVGDVAIQSHSIEKIETGVYSTSYKKRKHSNLSKEESLR